MRVSHRKGPTCKGDSAREDWESSWIQRDRLALAQAEPLPSEMNRERVRRIVKCEHRGKRQPEDGPYSASKARYRAHRSLL